MKVTAIAATGITIERNERKSITSDLPNPKRTRRAERNIANGDGAITRMMSLADLPLMTGTEKDDATNADIKSVVVLILWKAAPFRTHLVSIDTMRDEWLSSPIEI